MDKKLKVGSSLSAYVIASHIAFVVATPLIIFIWGGTWLADNRGWPEWSNIVLILAGIAVMALSLINYLRRLIAQYDDSQKTKKRPFKSESDYYYENNTKPQKKRRS